MSGSLTTLESRAFANCDALPGITLPATLTDIGQHVFSACRQMRIIKVTRDTSAESWVRENYPYMLAYASGAYRSSKLSFRISEDGHATIIGCNPSLVSLTIPDHINQAPVTAIAPGAFRDNQTLRNITLPAGVTQIGADAFHGCTRLTRITLPESVTTIGEDAFRDCRNLLHIGLPQGLQHIGDRAFSGCSALQRVTLPEGLLSLGAMAFHACTTLTAVTLPESLSSIGADPFVGCGSITAIDVVRGSDSAEWALAETSHPIVLSEPAGMVSGDFICRTQADGTLCIVGCEPTTERLDVPAEIGGVPVTAIGRSAFRDCSDVTHITLPGSIATIGDSAFRECLDLVSVTIPEGVTAIGRNAFRDCAALTALTLPGSIATIGTDAFTGCDALKLPDGLSD